MAPLQVLLRKTLQNVHNILLKDSISLYKQQSQNFHSELVSHCLQINLARTATSGRSCLVDDMSPIACYLCLLHALCRNLSNQECRVCPSNEVLLLNETRYTDAVVTNRFICFEQDYVWIVNIYAMNCKSWASDTPFRWRFVSDALKIFHSCAKICLNHNSLIFILQDLMIGVDI